MTFDYDVVFFEEFVDDIIALQFYRRESLCSLLFILSALKYRLSMPHKSLSTKGKTERTEKQRTEKKSRQTLSTFCLDFGWIQGDGIEGLQRADWIEATQRAKNARKGA